VRRLAGVIAGLLLAVLVGGGATRVIGQPATTRPAHPGKATYDQYCATCHGERGQADGPAAGSLPIRPPLFTDGRIMNPLPDEFLFKVVSEGAGSVGLAPQMPAFRPPLTDRQIQDVIGYVRTFAQPPYQALPAVAVKPWAAPPAQPIEFSHVVHAGSYRIECQYCHADARRSIYAGLPSVERCMGCHKIVAAQGNPEIQKLQEHWNQKQSVPWVRIHKVPGYVYFPHKRHIAAKLDCQECHGPVERMQRVAQVSPLSMGWCIECHSRSQPGAPLDCVVCHH
jgi:mono/diheme cytochrome c family protein